MGLPIFIRAFRKVSRVLDCLIFKSNIFHSDRRVKRMLEDIRLTIMLLHPLMTEYYTCNGLLYNVATSSNERVLYLQLLSGVRSNKYEVETIMKRANDITFV